MKNLFTKEYANRVFTATLALALCAGACRKPDSEPSRGEPVVEGYSPEAGGGGTELMISGNNFGNSTTNVEVWVNQVPAKVVSVTPTRIFAVVPAKAGSGAVKVAVDGVEFNQAKPFTYQFTRNVYTYSGSGAAVSVDGSLRQASFVRPYWLTYDRKDNALFVLEEGRRIRRIKEGRVETVATLTGSVNNPRNITMSLSCDTIFIGNDNAGNNNNVTVAILTRNSGFAVQQDYVRSTNETRHVNFAGIHPIDGSLIFYCWPRKLYTWVKAENRVKLLYDFVGFPGITGDFYANFCFSPDGREIYLTTKYPYIGILKAQYNAATQSIAGSFQRFAGTGSWGAADGLGINASFDQPAQVAVDANGNLYIAEKFNHWVRQVYPDGRVVRYAGDGGAGNQGFLDGTALSAKFNEPEGLAFDNEGNLYVADLRNSRIRVIRNE